MDRLNSLHGKVLTKSLSLVQLNEYLKRYINDKSSNVYNAKISFLRKAFDYLLDEGAVTVNYPNNKKNKPKPNKNRKRLDLDNYKSILACLTSYLSVAMRLPLQTTHAVNEISLAKYSDCKWFKAPVK